MKLYRKMFADTDGKPAVGDGRNMLGVRPRNPSQPRQARDVNAVVGTDNVLPGEGLSAYTDSGEIPPQVQGEMWVIETDDLPADLVVHQRGRNPRHYHIEPSREVELDAFQAMLANTRDLWELADGGANP